MKRRQWKPPYCKSGKAAYRTQGRAIRALNEVHTDNLQAVAPTNTDLKGVYKCRHCKAWHLTSREE